MDCTPEEVRRRHGNSPRPTLLPAPWQRDNLLRAMSFIPVILLIIVTLLAGANIYAYWRSRPSKLQEPIFHFQCKSCRRRLRYRARQAGNQGMCPRCHERFVFPPVPEKELKR